MNLPYEGQKIHVVDGQQIKRYLELSGFSVNVGITLVR
jgi:hypothetical protein